MPGTPRSPEDPDRVRGKVEQKAWNLGALATAHPAKGLMVAVAVRLGRDIDETREVRDRIAAIKMLLDVVEKLDGSGLPPAALPVVDTDDGDGTEPEAGPEGDDYDDVFDIGDMPPSVGDPTEPDTSDLGPKGGADRPPVG